MGKVVENNIERTTVKQQKNNRNIMKLFTKLLATAAIIISGFGFEAQAQLPAVQLKDINGKVVDTSTLSNDGKPFVISFWATWCKPCRRELKAISEVYEDWQEETGMKLIAVSIDEAQNVSKVKPVVDASGWEYEVLLDPSGDFKRAMGVQNVPHTIVVDGNGKVVESHQGYVEGAEEHLIELIRQPQSK